MNRAAPAITIAVPVHNAARFIPQAIPQWEALFAATTVPIEMVIVTDHCTDGSDHQLQQWAAEFATGPSSPLPPSSPSSPFARRPSIRIIERSGSQEQRPMVALARDVAVQHARGEYIWWCDVDDRWSPEVLNILYAGVKGDYNRTSSNRTDSGDVADTDGCGPGGVDGVGGNSAVGGADGGGPESPVAAEPYPVDMVCARATRYERGGRQWLMEGTDHPYEIRADELLTHDSCSTQQAVTEELHRWILRGDLRGYLWNKLIRRSVLVSATEAAARRERLSSQDDFMLLLDMLPHVRRVRFIPDVVYDYIEWPQSVSTGRGDHLNATLSCANRMVQEVRTNSVPAGSGTAGSAPTATDAHRFRRTVGTQNTDNRTIGRPITEAEISAFLLWFAIIPSCATPIAQQWPARHTTAVLRIMRATLTGPRWRRGMLQLLRWNKPMLAIHALTIRYLFPLYPTIWRLRQCAAENSFPWQR